ncbi:MAG: tetratricopeptide repeat protein [Acidobacteriota bacterium]
MQKHFITGILGLIIGLAVGFVGANKINRESSLPTSDPAIAAAAPNATTVSPGAAQADVAAMIERAQNEPQNFAVQMDMGQMYAKIGRFDKAAEFYRKGLAINPNNFQANVVLANALFDARQFEEAEKAYSRALEIDPKDVNARTDLGTTFVERANPDYDRGIKEFEAALTLDPKHEPSLYYLGITYFRKGDKENAEKALSRLEAVNPSSDLVARLKQNIAAK